MVSTDVIWLCVKNNNKFLVKRNGMQFSSEPNNLKSLNSYKFSGLCNPEPVSVNAAGAADDLSVKVTAKSEIVLKGVDVRQMSRKVESLLQDYRSDLKGAALSRLSLVHKSLRVAKAGVKKSKK
mmetsp:Transcript_46516/g.88818  ORF Transcript_46516/g.88818 Transcript_46516/m.88818 type:complete len:124 (+) Transcript_46516:67-438(+)|eukprot:CAMPEP_0114240256 /NCGR_PEP_ID=MMETSP0058-20121206/8956_1 /TAXON_ID=36894 /ORGANISM="Pyramimonas parkeae, CCMP726" /LENGTH=123 /DNA_ID=CAMNT_0001352611 /DNA_START=47 /DNA_END=418 /DNA_ORIENTATION=-